MPRAGDTLKIDGLRTGQARTRDRIRLGRGCHRWRHAGADALIEAMACAANGATRSGRTMRWVIGWVVCLLAGLMPVLAIAADYTIGPAPAWVVPIKPG